MGPSLTPKIDSSKRSLYPRAGMQTLNYLEPADQNINLEAVSKRVDKLYNKELISIICGEDQNMIFHPSPEPVVINFEHRLTAQQALNHYQQKYRQLIERHKHSSRQNIEAIRKYQHLQKKVGDMGVIEAIVKGSGRPHRVPQRKIVFPPLK